MAVSRSPRHPMAHNSISRSEWCFVFGFIPSIAGVQGEIEGVVSAGGILFAMKILYLTGTERHS